MVGVVLGCVIGLAINYIFRKITAPLFQTMVTLEDEDTPDNGGE
jgi:NhaP-type Na+/H+ or K+/H+ antiporter